MCLPCNVQLFISRSPSRLINTNERNITYGSILVWPCISTVSFYRVAQDITPVIQEGRIFSTSLTLLHMVYWSPMTIFLIILLRVMFGDFRVYNFPCRDRSDFKSNDSYNGCMRIASNTCLTNMQHSHGGTSYLMFHELSIIRILL